MIYRIRCTYGTDQWTFGFRGALTWLSCCGPDAAIYRIDGKWVAGRLQNV